nr:MAG TPA: ChiA1-BD-binding domain protein [Caudoviricetes sp.]
MRYIRKINGYVEESPIPPYRGAEYYAARGYLRCDSTLPLSRLDIVDGGIVELPEPGPTVEQVAAQTRDELTLRAAMLAIPLEDDTTALALAPVCPEWAAGTHYEAGEIVNHEGQAYRVVQSVDSLEHQPPDAEGMLAVYRPLDPHTGTVDDPKTFRYGMDVEEGKYYVWNEKIYLAKLTMPGCTYAPDTPGLWQWEEVTNA